MKRCGNCKYCKRLYVPPVPYFDHARTVNDRYVCIVFANEGQVQYLGDNEGMCEMYVGGNEVSDSNEPNDKG